MRRESAAKLFEKQPFCSGILPDEDEICDEFPDICLINRETETGSQLTACTATLSPSPWIFGVVVPFVKNAAVFGGICGRWLFAVVQRDGEVARILVNSGLASPMRLSSVPAPKLADVVRRDLAEHRGRWTLVLVSRIQAPCVARTSPVATE